MKRTIILGVLVVAFLSYGITAKADLSSAQKGRIGAELMIWWPTINGDTTFDTELIPGTELDLDSIMGLEQTKTTLELGVWFNPLKRYRLSVYWFLDKRSGDRILTEGITVAGETYNVGAEIDSSVEIQRVKIVNEFALLRNDLGRLAFGVGLVYLDAIAKVEGIASGGFFESTEERVQAPIPVVGASAEIHIPKLFGLGLFADGVGLSLKYKDVGASYFDVRGGASLKTRYVYALAGYQYINLQAEAFDELEVGLNLQGPFIAVGVKF
jgi:hypothetical protein